MLKLEIIEIDGELGLVLPPQMIEAMSLKDGSTLIATAEPRGYLLKPDDNEPSQPTGR
ncbi:MAG: hypothetical protein JOZ72_01700 [Alphaproteobacteria bacterium]|nr:hypothetical protein [Alphaproteobacteria bacterium]